jgi:hypothetical protein
MKNLGLIICAIGGGIIGYFGRLPALAGVLILFFGQHLYREHE